MLSLFLNIRSKLSIVVYLLLFSQEAKEKFQQLQKVMSILGDEEKRAVYDQTGCIDDAVSTYPTYTLGCTIMIVAKDLDGTLIHKYSSLHIHLLVPFWSICEAPGAYN